MSKIIALVAVIILMTACMNEDGNSFGPEWVPTKVTDTFKKSNPDRNNVEWVKDGEYFVAKYFIAGFEVEEIYDANGKLIAKETEIDKNMLLKPILDYLAGNYPNIEVEEAEMIETADGLFYQVDLEINGEEIELIFDSEGKFIKKIIDSEDEIDLSLLPTIIKTDIQSRYPGAKLIEADKITDEGGNVYYEIEIDYNNEIFEVLYNTEGKFIKEVIEEDEDEANEEEIDLSLLPTIIKTDIQSRYPGAKLIEADKITEADGKFYYDIEINYNGKFLDLVYDSEGKYLGLDQD